MLNKKIALCIFGMARTIREVFPSWHSNIIELLNPDIFISTNNVFWAPTNIDPIFSKPNTEELSSDYLNHTYNYRLKDFSILPFNPDKFKEKVEKDGLPENNGLVDASGTTQKLHRIYSMFFHIKNVLRLRQEYEQKNNTKYDMIILARPDLIIAKPIDLSIIENDLDMFWTSGSHMAPMHGFPGGWIGDHMMVSSPKIIDLLGDIYDSIPSYYKNGITPNQETLIGYQLIKNNIRFDVRPFISHDIRR